MNIKKLGRIENCCGNCSILNGDNVNDRVDFQRVFDYTGTPEFSYVFDTTSMDSIDSSRRDDIKFNTYCTLTLKEPSAIFANDNFALFMAPQTLFTEGIYSTQTEEFIFTIGSHTIKRKHEYYGTATSSVGHYVFQTNAKLTVTFDGTEVYNNCGANVIYQSDANYNVYPNYIIRRGGWLYYYIDKFYIGRLYDDITKPVNFNYQWYADNNCTLHFNQHFGSSWNTIINIWKPDKWYDTLPWQKYSKPPKQTDDNLTSKISNVYAKYNADKLECEGCTSPAREWQNTDVKTYRGKGSPIVNSNLIDTVTFRALSPVIGINIHGFTPYNNNIPGNISEGSCSYWNYDGDTGNYGDVYHDITVDDVPGLSDAILSGQTNINSIMESYANTLTSQGYGFDLSWTNGSTVSLSYTNIENVMLPGIVGGDTITFQDMPPVTYLTNNTATYPDTTDNWGNAVNHYNNEIRRSKTYNWDTSQYDWSVSRYVSNSTGTSRTNPFDSYSTDICDQTGITDVTLKVCNGIVAPTLCGKVGYNHIYEISIPEGYEGVKPSRVSTSTSSYPKVVDVEITDQPGEGNVTLDKTNFPYKIQYQSPTLPQYNYTTFEYRLTDDYGAKSSAIVTVFFDDTKGDDSITLSSGSQSSNFGMPDYRLDYDVIVCVRFTLKGVGSTNLWYIHDGNILSLDDLYGKTARYITALDTQVDSNNNPIRQMYTMDGQSHTNVVADFYQATVEDNCLNHQVNFALVDDLDDSRKPYNVEYIEATVDCYYNQHDYDNGTSEWVDRERKTCILNPANTLDCHCVTRLDTDTPYRYEGAFSYTHAEDGEDHTSTETLIIDVDYNDTFPDCLSDFSHDIVLMGSGYNQNIGYKVISFTIHYVDDAKSPVTYSDWEHN